MKNIYRRLKSDLENFILVHKKKLPYIIGAFFILLVYALSKYRNHTEIVYNEKPETKTRKIISNHDDSIYSGKEKILTKNTLEILERLKNLGDKVDKLEKKNDAPVVPNPPVTKSTEVSSTVTPVNLYPSNVASEGRAVIEGKIYRGADLISFPVTALKKDVEDTVSHQGVSLPSGSYVKAKLMTGVEAPEGKTYPVLLQLDHVFIAPNKHRIDLSGCFIIAKAEGDLSTERVQMQATKLSCVSKKGKMFEREISGFVADDKDNSFAVGGSVNSKQDRVAAMSFLSKVVEGIGKAIQNAQTTTTTGEFGSTASNVTGDQGKYILAGGATGAASQVADWYLKQAQNLLPTISVVSGQDVWIVLQNTIKLPTEFFKKVETGGDYEFIYYSRILD